METVVEEDENISINDAQILDITMRLFNNFECKDTTLNIFLKFLIRI